MYVHFYDSLVLLTKDSSIEAFFRGPPLNVRSFLLFYSFVDQLCYMKIMHVFPLNRSTAAVWFIPADTHRFGSGCWAF